MEESIMRDRFETAAICAAIACTANAAVFTWDGGGSDNTWQTAANWSGDVAPDTDGTAALVFAGSAAKTASNDFPAGTAFASLTLNNTAAFTLSGNGITLTGPLTTAAAGTAITDTLALPIALGADLALTLNSNHALTSSGVISGASGLSKSGAGNLTLNGLNTYTGQTVLSGGGRIYYNSLKNLGEPCSFGAPTTPEAGTLFLNAITEYKGGDTATDRNLWFAAGVQLYNSGTGTLTLNGGIGGPNSPSIRGARNIVINGPVTNTLAFSRTDTGTLFLNHPANTFPGNLTISDGTIVAVTLADSDTACSIGKGNMITFGQTGWETTGRLRYAGAADAACNRSLRFNSLLLSHGGQIENAAAGTTITFSGAVSTAIGTGVPANTAIPLWLTGAGDGVMASALPAGLRVIKQGAGTWRLTGANVHTGATSVTAGTLLIDGSTAAASAVSVTSGATLGGTGTVHGAVSVAAGGILAPGDLNATGTLTLASAELDSALLVFDLQNPADGPSDRLDITGALNSAHVSTVMLNLPAEGLPAGTYTLATYASRSGALALQEGLPGMILTVGSTELTLTVVPSGAVTDLAWTGAASAVWDFASANWAPQAARYADGLNVTFDDSGAAGAPVTIPAPVAPNTVTFNTTNNAYTLAATGAAGLSGDAWLAKRGPAALTLEGTHTHTGATVIDEGALLLAGTLTSSALVIGKDATLQQAPASVIAGEIVSVTVQGKAWLYGANTYGGETVAGCAGEYNHDITVCNNLALGSTAAGTTVVGGHAQNHNRVTLAPGITVTGETLTLTGNGRAALAYTNASGSATWDGDIVPAHGALAYINCNQSGGTLIIGTPGTAAVITGNADIQFRESGTIICNSRLLMDGHAVVRNNNGTLVLNSTNNAMATCQIAEGTLRLGADNALPATVTVNMGKNDDNTSNKAYFDLNGHTQTIARFIESHHDAFTGSQIGCQLITSALPATLIFGGAATNTLVKRNSDFRGAVTVVQAGAGLLEIGQTNLTSGAFVVSNGVLRLNATGGSVGPNCTDVTVAGGTLELQNPAALSPNVNVTFPADTTGVIDIPAGVNVPANTLWFGATQKRAGTWGASGSGAQYVDDTRFTGTGTLTVLRDKSGFQMILR
jgi:autotransporter-associated beta strand protein